MKKTLIALLVLIATLVVYSKIDKAPSKENISAKLISWKAKEQIFDYEGYNLSYHDSKDDKKKVLILLHGYPTSSYDWYPMWSELKKDYRLIAMDMLGFGFSDKPDNIRYTISLQADILEALLKKLNIKKAHVLAHDYGDNIAQELLARNMEEKEMISLQIQSLTLLNGGLFPESHRPTIIQSLLASPAGGIISSLSNETLFEKGFSKVFGSNTKPGKQEIIDQWYLICQLKGNKIAHKLTRAANDRKANRERWVGGLEKSSTPILFINGIADPVTGKETVERYLELIPKPNVIKLDTIGHFPQLENPKLIIKHLKTFIERTN